MRTCAKLFFLFLLCVLHFNVVAQPGWLIDSSSNCQSLPEDFPNFQTALQYQTLENASLYATPQMADLNGDGAVEIVAMSANGIDAGATGGPRSSKDINVYNGQTGVLLYTIVTPYMSWDGPTPFAIGDVNNDGTAEIILASLFTRNAAIDQKYLFCYSNLGVLLWKSNQQYGVNNGNGSASSVGLADFNQDGTPEVYVYNEIFNAATGIKLVDGGANGTGNQHSYNQVVQAITTAGDLRPSPGLELAAGRTVYEVNIVNTAGTAGNSMTAFNVIGVNPDPIQSDGFTAMADINLDGNLDIIVNSLEGNIYVWNPITLNVIAQRASGFGGFQGPLFIGDVDGDGFSDIGYCRSNAIDMLSFNGTPALQLKWSLAVIDFSGRTGLTMFDFNQDGVQEIVYRDESNLRVMDGSGATAVNLVTFPSISTTGMEGPIIGDIDNDGSAEIIIATDPEDNKIGVIQVFRSNLSPWAPARKVWNQYAYFSVNINDDLTIPQFQFDHGEEVFFGSPNCPNSFQSRPLNNFNVQSTVYTVEGCPNFPVVDATVVINSTELDCETNEATIRLTVTNEADQAAIEGPFTIAFYDGDPLTGGSVFLDTATFYLYIPPGSNSGILTVVLSNISSGTNLYTVANDSGQIVTPIVLPNTEIVECDYSNNFSFATIDCIVDLQVLKTVSDPVASVGDTISFDITVTNNGPIEATNVEVIENIPAGYSVLSVVPSQGTWMSPLWTVGSLILNQSESLIVTVIVNDTEDYLNTVAVTSDQLDTIPENDTSSVEPLIVNCDITIAATAISDPITCGGDGNLLLTFTNVPDGIYTIDYLTGQFVTVSVLNDSATILAPAGVYVDFSITVGACTTEEFPDAELIDPNPPADNIISNLIDTSTCQVNNITDSLIYLIPVLDTGDFKFYYTINNGALDSISLNGPGNITLAIPKNIPGTFIYQFSSVTNLDNVCSTILNIDFNAIIRPLPVVSAGSDATICEDASVTLTATGAGVNATYSWNNNVVNGVSFNPSVGGVDYIVLGTTQYGCNDRDTVNVLVNPKPANTMWFNVESLCSPATISFMSGSVNPDEACQWLFSDGSTHLGCDLFTLDFNATGDLDAQLIINNTATGCNQTITDNAFVTLPTGPVANFVASPNEISILNGKINFINNTVGATAYSWDFGDLSGNSNLVNPSHTYSTLNETNYTVTLAVVDQFGCRDTARSTIIYVDEFLFYVPNTFTPNQDQYNNGFNPVFSGEIDLSSYSLLIFNRWGELIFESHDPKIGWNGKYGVDGNQCQDGTYTWKLSFSPVKVRDRVERVGHVNILR